MESGLALQQLGAAPVEGGADGWEALLSPRLIN